MWTVFTKKLRSSKDIREMYTGKDVFIYNDSCRATVVHNDNTRTDIYYCDLDIDVENKIVTFYLDYEDENTEVPSGTSKAIKW